MPKLGWFVIIATYLLLSEVLEDLTITPFYDLMYAF